MLPQKPQEPELYKFKGTDTDNQAWKNCNPLKGLKNSREGTQAKQSGLVASIESEIMEETEINRRDCHKRQMRTSLK